MALPSTAGRRVWLPPVWLIIIAQVAAHLVLLPVGGWIGDTRLLQTWAVRLTGYPVSTFYASVDQADHLPGDLWILKLEAVIYRLVSGHPPANTGFLNALKLGPGLADAGIAIAIYLIARSIAGERAGRLGALLFALNPAPYLVSMVWGVADSVSMCVAAVAVYLVVRGWFWAAIPVLAYACLIKPQLGILAPLLLVFFLHESWKRTGRRRWLRPALELIVAGAGSLAVLLVTLLPFNVGIPLIDRQWTLTGRIRYAADLYTATTMNALNIWAFLSTPKTGFPIINGVSDHTAGLFGLSDQRWAIVLTVAAGVVLALPLIRKGGADRLIWTCATVTFAFFMLQTRIHERYFFPAVALTALAVALRPRWVWLYLAMSAIYFVNVWWIYGWLDRDSGGGFGRTPGGFGGRGVLNRPAGGGGFGAAGGASAKTTAEVRLLVAVNGAVLAVFVIQAILDFRKPAEATLLDQPGVLTNAVIPT